jgi:antitoxin MazE
LDRGLEILSVLIYIESDVYQRRSTVQVAKWGNSLAVRLPAAVVEALELRAGDEIEIHVADRRELKVARKPDRAELLARLRVYRGRLPADFKFDRDEANAR